MSVKDSVSNTGIDLSSGSYYYMSSSNVTTYNDDNNYTSRQKVIVNNNGAKDKYYKKSVSNNGVETIVKENGNPEILSQARPPVIFHQRRGLFDDFFEPFHKLFWRPWSILRYDNQNADQPTDAIKADKPIEISTPSETNIVSDTKEKTD